MLKVGEESDRNYVVNKSIRFLPFAGKAGGDSKESPKK